MAGFLQGLLGAGMGFLSGGPAGALVGGVGGLSGTGTHEDAIQKEARLRQQGMANQMLGYANSVPGSSPDELANMAQNRALLGEQQRQQQNRVMGAWTPDQGTSSTGLLQSLGNTAIAQQMAQRSGFLQDAAANRRQALLQASGLNQQAAGMYQPKQSQLSELLGQLSQSLAYRQTQRQLGQAGGTGTTTASPELQAELARLGIHIPGSPPTAFPHDWWMSGTPNGPAGSLTPGKPRYTSLSGMGDDPNMTALLMALQQQQPGQMMGQQPGQPMGMLGGMQPGVPMAQQPSMQGPQGLNVPQNDPGGANAVANQARQANSLGRSILLPGGMRLNY